MKKKSLAIIGAGITGLSAALQLAASEAFEISIYEKNDYLGGLSSSWQRNGFTCDRFYHVVLSTDTVLLRLLRQLDLESKLFWAQTKSGFYGNRQLVSLSSMGDFLAFPFLSLWQKFRLGLGILYSARLKDARRLDRIYVRQWLTRVFGRRVYEKIWDPLLRSKLGASRERTSAAFIWATIKRLYGARSSADKVEKLGHVQGGYQRIIEALTQKLASAGIRIHLNHELASIRYQGDGGGFLLGFADSNIDNVHSDLTLCTQPSPLIVRALCDAAPHPYWERLASTEYLGVICVLVLLRRSLSPYYVINLLDKDMPFTGVIESTNVIPSEQAGGYHLVYLPKYYKWGDPLESTAPREIAARFLDGLKTMFSDLREEDIAHTEVFAERFVQPLQEIDSLRYADQGLMATKTPLPGLYVANSSMILNNTLNNNAALSIADSAAARITAEQGITPEA